MRYTHILLALFLLVIFSTSAFAVEDPDKYKLYKFTYMEKDDCGCFIEPDICGGGPYMASLQRRVFYAWHPPDTTTDKEAVVTFRIHRNGKLSDLKLVSKSNSPFAQSALQAIQDAAPFYPLPPGAPEDVEIQFTFPIEFKIMTGFKPSEYKIVPYSKRQIANFDYLRFRLAPYLDNLQSSVRKKWNQSYGNRSKVVIDFTMNAEGMLYNFAPTQSDELSTREMLDLIKQSSPIDLPPGLPGEVRIKFAFDPTIRHPYILEAQLIKH